MCKVDQQNEQDGEDPSAKPISRPGTKLKQKQPVSFPLYSPRSFLQAQQRFLKMDKNKAFLPISAFLDKKVKKGKISRCFHLCLKPFFFGAGARGGRRGPLLDSGHVHYHFPCWFLCTMINKQTPLMMVVELMMNREGGKMVVGDRDHHPYDKSYCSSAHDYNFTPGSPF